MCIYTVCIISMNRKSEIELCANWIASVRIGTELQDTALTLKRKIQLLKDIKIQFMPRLLCMKIFRFKGNFITTTSPALCYRKEPVTLHTFEIVLLLHIYWDNLEIK